MFGHSGTMRTVRLQKGKHLTLNPTKPPVDFRWSQHVLAPDESILLSRLHSCSKQKSPFRHRRLSKLPTQEARVEITSLSKMHYLVINELSKLALFLAPFVNSYVYSCHSLCSLETFKSPVCKFDNTAVRRAVILGTPLICGTVLYFSYSYLIS